MDSVCCAGSIASRSPTSGSSSSPMSHYRSRSMCRLFIPFLKFGVEHQDWTGRMPPPLLNHHRRRCFHKLWPPRWWGPIGWNNDKEGVPWGPHHRSPRSLASTWLCPRLVAAFHYELVVSLRCLGTRCKVQMARGGVNSLFKKSTSFTKEPR
jgi:hypothetical protein